jgi:hypothetical protein
MANSKRDPISDYLESLKQEGERAERMNPDRRREAEIELLDSAPNMKEYMHRRQAMKHLVTADLPLQEMGLADYVKTRNRSGRGDVDIERELLRSGRLTYADYKEMREAEEDK